MFYLMTHSTHFILRLYHVRHIVKAHLERKPSATITWATLSDYQQGFFYMHHHRQDSTYHSLCYTSHGALAGTRKSLMSHPFIEYIIK